MRVLDVSKPKGFREKKKKVKLSNLGMRNECENRKTEVYLGENLKHIRKPKLQVCGQNSNLISFFYHFLILCWLIRFSSKS